MMHFREILKLISPIRLKKKVKIFLITAYIKIYMTNKKRQGEITFYLNKTQSAENSFDLDYKNLCYSCNNYIN